MEDGTVEIYSRNAERNTGKYPDVVDAVSRYTYFLISSTNAFLNLQLKKQLILVLLLALSILCLRFLCHAAPIIMVSVSLHMVYWFSKSPLGRMLTF